MNILIGGDLVPNGKTEELFKNGHIDKILGTQLNKKWQEASFKFFNLECPMTNSNNTILKTGPNLKCSPDAINGIKLMSPTCIMLANNHIKDYSSEGVTETIKLLDDNKIDWIGVGKNNNNLRKSYSFVANNKKIVIYNCCEHEFSIATENDSGANPYDEFATYDELKKLKENNDILIVIFHGGKEYYRYPSPLLQKRCRKMIDAGANIVICQHSHCIGCKEDYKNGTIIYGQGNFIFNRKRDDFWNTSLLIEIEINSKTTIKYIPLSQTSCGTELSNKKEADDIINSFNKRSSEIKRSGFIEEKYRKYAKEKLDNYMIMMNGKNLKLRIIHKFLPKLFKKIKFDYVGILNAVECESHNELLIEGLKEKIQESKND